MEVISLRVEAEDQYEKAINRALQKLNDIHSSHPLYSRLTRAFKTTITERIHQVRGFKHDLAK